MAKRDNVVPLHPRPKQPSPREQADNLLHVVWCSHAAGFTKPGTYDREGLKRAEKAWNDLPQTPFAELHAAWREYLAYIGDREQAMEAWRAAPHRMRTMPADLTRQRAWRKHHEKDRLRGRELLSMVQAVALAYPEKSLTSIVRLVAATVTIDKATPSNVARIPEPEPGQKPKPTRLASAEEATEAVRDNRNETIERQIWLWIRNHEKQFPPEQYPELALFPGRRRRS
jgi:hypothetical protein